MITCPFCGNTYDPSDFGWGINRLENPDARRVAMCRRGCGKHFEVVPDYFTIPYPLPRWKSWARSLKWDWIWQG